MSLPPPPTTLRILLLHGYTQSSTLFLHKSAALQKHLQKHLPSHKFVFSCPRAPHRLKPADIPDFEYTNEGNESEELDAWGWWLRKDHADGEIVYEGLEEALRVIGQLVVDEGPFDGVIGFSQGGCAAGIVASLLEKVQQSAASIREEEEEEEVEEGRPKISGFLDAFTHGGLHSNDAVLKKFTPLKFAIIYSGFEAPGKRYEDLYSPKISTPTLHFAGTLDSVVEESRSRALLDVCEKGELIMFPGGHYLPSQRVWMDACLEFVKRYV